MWRLLTIYAKCLWLCHCCIHAWLDAGIGIGTGLVKPTVSHPWVTWVWVQVSDPVTLDQTANPCPWVTVFSSVRWYCQGPCNYVTQSLTKMWGQVLPSSLQGKGMRCGMIWRNATMRLSLRRCDATCDGAKRWCDVTVTVMQVGCSVWSCDASYNNDRGWMGYTGMQDTDEGRKDSRKHNEVTKRSATMTKVRTSFWPEGRLNLKWEMKQYSLLFYLGTLVFI